MYKALLAKRTTVLILLTVSVLFPFFCQAASKNNTEPEWINIIVHGTVGFQANLQYKTICQAKNDCIEGTKYERNVLGIREHPYLFSLQPMQKIGLHEVKDTGNMLNASYAFVHLFQEVQCACGIQEKGLFYTYGWSGLISERRRYAEACILYKKIREIILDYQKRGITIKIRLMGYSHGATLLLNLGDLAKDFLLEPISIDETYLIGLPVTTTSVNQVESPVFKKVYNIYSRGDKVQRLDIFSQCDFFSRREFKGCLPDNLTQIEMKLTACLRKDPCINLPTRMRGMFNQSPGHIELWFFGWAPSSYRKNLSFYPMPGAVFIPYLICSTKKINSKHIIVDIRPEQEKMLVKAKYGFASCTLPFMSRTEYTTLINKAMEFHPSHTKYKDEFVKMQTSIDVNAYK